MKKILLEGVRSFSNQNTPLFWPKLHVFRMPCYSIGETLADDFVNKPYFFPEIVLCFRKEKYVRAQHSYIVFLKLLKILLIPSLKLYYQII